MAVNLLPLDNQSVLPPANVHLDFFKNKTSVVQIPKSPSEILNSRGKDVITSSDGFGYCCYLKCVIFFALFSIFFA